MTFMEVLLLIQERGEAITSDKIHTIQTDKYLYVREPDGSWIQKELPVQTIVVDPFPPLETVLPKIKKKKK